LQFAEDENQEILISVARVSGASCLAANESHGQMRSRFRVDFPRSTVAPGRKREQNQQVRSPRSVLRVIVEHSDVGPMRGCVRRNGFVRGIQAWCDSLIEPLPKA
jgi:hypothetical protein